MEASEFLRRYPSYTGDCSVCDTNLIRLDTQQARLFSKRRAVLQDKLYALLENVAPEKQGNLWESDALLWAMVSNQPSFSALRSGVATHVSTRSSDSMHTTVLDQLMLCRMLMHDRISQESAAVFIAKYLTQLNQDMHAISEQSTQNPVRICYVKGDLADAAIDMVLQTIPNTVAVQSSSFQAACDAVYYGRCEACLLPVENSYDGWFMSFLRMVTEYELCAVLRCELYTPEKDILHAFSLYRAEHSAVERDMSAPLYMETLFHLSDTDTLSALFLAAADCRVTLHRITSRQEQGSLHTQLFHVLFDISGADIQTFLCYLYLTVPSFHLIGIYTVLHKTEGETTKYDYSRH